MASELGCRSVLVVLRGFQEDYPLERLGSISLMTP